MTEFIRPIQDVDRERVKEIMVNEWGSDLVIVHQTKFFPHHESGFIAENEAQWTGLVTYEVRDDVCEILTLNSFLTGQGIGDSLIKAVERIAKSQRCRTLMLVTTNDNLNALRFYQKRGFCITSIDVGAVDAARKTKPEIPLSGENGIPLRDEITLKKICRDVSYFERIFCDKIRQKQADLKRTNL